MHKFPLSGVHDSFVFLRNQKVSMKWIMIALDGFMTYDNFRQKILKNTVRFFSLRRKSDKMNVTMVKALSIKLMYCLELQNSQFTHTFQESEFIVKRG